MNGTFKCIGSGNLYMPPSKLLEENDPSWLKIKIE